MTMTPQQQTEFEAAAFRRLVQHLANRPDVQNIDLMNLAGFCRNCLANWLADAAREAGVEIGKDQAREMIYGMPYETFKEIHQRDVDGAKKAAFDINRPKE